MRSLATIEELSTIAGPVVLCIGVFDGVHLGHQAVIRQARADAAALGGTAVVLTFDPHPARVLRPEAAPRLLTSRAHKARLLEAAGVEVLLVVRFDDEFAAREAADFVEALAGAARPLRQISVGEKWTFGRGRTGNVELLRELGERLGFSVHGMEPVAVDGETVSSTRVRRAVEAGDFVLARRCLGRDYAILGTVEAGRRLGRTIGFPTANLRAHNEQFPPDGVYAVRCEVGGETRDGVANIGVRPTVAESGAERTLEVHLFDFAQDLYGRDVEVTFVKWLRGERRFADVAALKEQIGADSRAAREILGSAAGR
jgi:riboflavin kinase/FMN adenylyltransferase